MNCEARTLRVPRLRWVAALLLFGLLAVPSSLSAQGDPLSQCREQLRQRITDTIQQQQRQANQLQSFFVCLLQLAVIEQQQSLEEDVIELLLDASGELDAAAFQKALAALLPGVPAAALDAAFVDFEAHVCSQGVFDASSGVRALADALKRNLQSICDYDTFPQPTAQGFCDAVDDFVAKIATNAPVLGAPINGIDAIDPVAVICEAIDRITLPQTSFLDAATAEGWRNAIQLRRAARALINQCALDLIPLALGIQPPTLTPAAIGILALLDAFPNLQPTSPLYGPFLALCQAIDSALAAQLAEYTAQLDRLQECLDLLALLKDDLLAFDILDPFTSDFIRWSAIQVAVECLTAIKEDFVESSAAAKQRYEDAVRAVADKVKQLYVFGPEPSGCSLTELRDAIRAKLVELMMVDFSSGTAEVNPALCDVADAEAAKDALESSISRIGIGVIPIFPPPPDDQNGDGIADPGTEKRMEAESQANKLIECVCALELVLGPDGNPVLSGGIGPIIEAGGGQGPAESCEDALERGILALGLPVNAAECAKALCFFYDGHETEPVTKEQVEDFLDCIQNAEAKLEAACAAVDAARAAAALPDGKTITPAFKQWLMDIIKREYNPEPGKGIQDKINEVIAAIDSQLGDALVNKFKTRSDWMALCAKIDEATDKICMTLDDLNEEGQEIEDNLIDPAIDHYLDLLECKEALMGG